MDDVIVTGVMSPAERLTLIIELDVEQGQINLKAPVNADPLIVFQVLNHLAQAQLRGLLNEVNALREQLAGRNLVIPADANGVARSLREFRDDR